MLVIDASVAVWATSIERGFATFGRERLVAPALLWSESRSALHEAQFRREITTDAAQQRLRRLDSAPIRARDHDALSVEAWRIADEFGWAKTYDAEYVALALLLRCKLVTLDERLRRRTARLDFVVGPEEL